MEKPLVSVCLISYNHADYIRQAIDGVVNQKVNFEWELIIADDFSTDGTRDIIEEYYNKHPDFIKLVLQKNNVGPGNNWRDLLNAANGKYIAYCEGDDYWTDACKIQKQVNFLESHPGYSGCFHNTEERFEDETVSSFLYCNYPSAQNISFRELSLANVIPSCSMVYRNRLFEFPEWIYTLKMGDWPLHLLNAQYGDYWYMPKVMAVHRLHDKSTWMLQDAGKNRQFTIDAYDTMIKSFGNNADIASHLMNGKELFVNLANPLPQQLTLGRRVKNFLISIIEKF